MEQELSAKLAAMPKDAKDHETSVLLESVRRQLQDVKGANRASLVAAADRIFARYWDLREEQMKIPKADKSEAAMARKAEIKDHLVILRQAADALIRAAYPEPEKPETAGVGQLEETEAGENRQEAIRDDYYQAVREVLHDVETEYADSLDFTLPYIKSLQAILMTEVEEDGARRYEEDTGLPIGDERRGSNDVFEDPPVIGAQEPQPKSAKGTDITPEARERMENEGKKKGTPPSGPGTKNVVSFPTPDELLSKGFADELSKLNTYELYNYLKSRSGDAYRRPSKFASGKNGGDACHY